MKNPDFLVYSSMNLHEIIAQLNEVYDGNPWYGNSVSNYLQEIKPEMMSNKCANSHSIGQVIAHMVTWREYVIAKLENKAYDLEVGGANDWEDHEFTADDKVALYAKFKATQKSLTTILSGKSDEFLTQKAPDLSITFEKLLIGIIQHDIYHLGQIYLLRSVKPAR